jgi:mono/diheme cytochrome c family protein
MLKTALWLPLTLATTAATAAPVDFVREVRPILEQHCYECHGPEKQKNEYRLDIRQVALTGGEHHAPNIVPGKAAESPLIRFVSGADPDLQMPPKKKLSDADVATLRRWVDEGAVWPAGVDTAKLEDRRDWWSLKPLTKPRGAGGIDSFIDAKLREAGLRRAPEADARTLIRRLYFDLIGLPPTPEEVEAFAAEAAADNDAAYERLVDRLLASPRHGERWARHWLDAVHFGETHGYDKDKPRLNAWPYRDYVIRAFNEDKPYARFIREQIAGDVLHPGTPDGITALGLIAAGPWDLIGHMEVPESKVDGKIARHLDRDDMVQNTFGTFCSLTVQCAQCHNHKFDPITQEDYYSLQAVFAAVDRTELKYYPDAAVMKRFVNLQKQRTAAQTALAAVEQPLVEKAGAAYAELTRRIQGASTKTAKVGNARPDFGYHSAISPTQDAVKWVQVDLGRQVEIASVVLKPCYDDYNAIGAGFGFPVRFKIETSDDPQFRSGVTLLWRRHDETFMNDFRNPGLQAFSVSGADDDGTKGRYVRVTAVKLAPRRNDFIFALAELEVHDAAGKNAAAGAQVSALDAIEAPPRWRKANLTDGIAPEPAAPDEAAQLAQQRESLLLRQATPEVKQELLKRRAQVAQVEAGLKQLPPPQTVYAGGVHHGTGNFAGTGASGGQPRPIFLLKRGDVKTPDKEVAPAAVRTIAEVSGLPASFASAADERARRAALAEWIADKRNPLTWRSIVNRVWQHHFGRGLVETANDFGRMGALPSHPELLDWLAMTFRDDLRGSLKGLHKLMVMSSTYRQASTVDNPAAAAADADNRWLWRQNRRKLDAECVRDSILAVSGKLDLAMGGPSFQDFVIDKPQHSPHYLYDRHDPEDPKSWRRSIYRFIVRSQQQPFMTVMDCADPSMRVDKRNESLSPLQALAMMNNGLVVSMAGHFAARVEAEATGTEARVRRAYSLALGRAPEHDEWREMAAYAEANGLPNLCRLLLNLNEFAFVD